MELRQWKALTQPILLIEALGTFCKTDDPSAALDPRAQQLLSDLLEAIGPARDVLRTSFRKGRRRLRM